MHSVTRRRFVQGLVIGGCGGRLTWPGTARALCPTPSLSGPEIALEVDTLPVRFRGAARLATAINGSLPGPTLRFREGDTVSIHVRNRLSETTSLHWHGLRLPADQDGVPGLTFAGIAPGSTFSYRFPIRQSGTYWYHSHSGMQEQTGMYGALILQPREPEPYSYDRDYVVLLSDWTNEDPMTVVSNLKQQSDYYNYQRRTTSTWVHDVHQQGLKPTLQDRLMWGRMRMSATDIQDVTGSTYTYLINGMSSADNWSGLFQPGEKIRLRFINGSSMSTFDVRIPGLPMTLVAADGSDVEPVSIGEFRIGVAETYDVIVAPPKDAAYSIFAQAQDRSGFVRATLAPRAGMSAPIPALDARPLRSMSDMGMGAGMGGMAGMDMDMSGMAGMQMDGMDSSGNAPPKSLTAATNADGLSIERIAASPFVDHVSDKPQNRLGEAGDGLDGNGRRNLLYTDLKALHPDPETRAPDREIEFHLTGNMQRFVWGFDGKKFSDAAPIRIKLGERVRIVLINDTMMEHPIHLHGFLFSLENGQDALPLKHTVNVKPNERLSLLFTADTPGHWAFHCHLLYHMETGMFRTVLVA